MPIATNEHGKKKPMLYPSVTYAFPVITQANPMIDKVRDFYHIQDQLPLAWRYLSNRGRAADSKLEDLTRQMDALASSLIAENPELGKFIDLSNKKISILERALQTSGWSEAPASEICNLSKQQTEVSLSSSGMGFFSDSLADDDAKIEIALTLDTLDLDVNFFATVLECRRSADAENPGYWIRVRFDRNQEQQTDQLLGHVTQRQIEKLQRSSKSPSTSVHDGVK